MNKNQSINVLIVSPVLNEAAGISSFIEAVLSRTRQYNNTKFRLLLVDDGSTDGSLGIIKKKAQENPSTIGFVSLSGNHGYHAAMIAGLSKVDDWPTLVVTMDSDMEHPLSVVDQMVDVFIKDAPLLINGIRNRRPELNFGKRFFSKLFYICARLATGLSLETGQGDFRAWDANVIRNIQPELKKASSLRLFASWIKGKKVNIFFDQDLQPQRRSRFTFRKNLELALSGIFRFSDMPFRLIWGVGFLGVLFAFLYGLYIIVAFIKGAVIPGWTSLIITLIFFGCLQLLSIGTLGYYLKYLIFDKYLPLYIVKEKSLFDGSLEKM